MLDISQPSLFVYFPIQALLGGLGLHGCTTRWLVACLPWVHFKRSSAPQTHEINGLRGRELQASGAVLLCLIFVRFS
jgi:hypothetical protein